MQSKSLARGARRRWVGPLAALALLCLQAPSAIAGQTGREPVAAKDVGTTAVLAEGTGFANPGGSEQVRQLQRRLERLGQSPGPVDGLFGPRTEAAVIRFQGEQGIATDGLVGPNTKNALRRARPTLRRGAGFGEPRGSEQVRQLQRRLERLGQSPGPVDGLFGPRTEAAVIRFQGEQGIATDGLVGPVTRRVSDRQSRELSQTREIRARAETKPRRTATKSLRNASKPQRNASKPQRNASKPQRNASTGGGPPASRRSAENARQRVAQRSDSGLSDGELAVIVAACALGVGLLGAGALVARRDRRQPPKVIPMYHDMLVEGRSGDANIGEFGGQALAVSLGEERDGEGAPETRYLVADPDRTEPFWVGSSDISRFERAEAPIVTEAEPEEHGELRALGYATSPSADGLKGGELERQAEAIERASLRLGLTLVEVVRDVESENGKGRDRPGLAYALEQIAAGKASCLLVAELERLSRSVTDLGTLLDWFEQGNSRLVAADMGLDTATPSGRFASRVLVSVSGWERERLSERTRKGLEAARARGVATGRPAVADRPALRERITDMRAEGMTLQAIADTLNEEGVPTLRGGTKWRPSSVQSAAGYKRRRKNGVSHLPPPNGQQGSDSEKEASGNESDAEEEEEGPA